MKFVPRSLPENAADASRGHDRHPLRELALLATGVALICGVLYLVALLAAEAILTRISPQTEARLLRSFSEALPEPDNLDPHLESRRQTAEELFVRLLGPTNTLAARLIVWDNPETNALALPGGTVALTRGLLQCLDTEPAMSFVLAHELGHLHARDHLRGWGRHLAFQVVVALVFSDQPDVAANAGQIGQLGYLAHSRARETAADAFALQLVHDRFGTEEGATRLLELLEQERLPGWAYMFSTHPATPERLRRLRAQAAVWNTNSLPPHSP